VEYDGYRVQAASRDFTKNRRLLTENRSVGSSILPLGTIF
jgi:hypothetical protein